MRAKNKTERRGRTYCSGCGEPARTDPHPECADAVDVADYETNELKEAK